MNMENFVIPSSGAHLGFYHYLLILALMIFLSYSAVFFGSSVLSIIFRVMGKDKNNSRFMKLSMEYVDLITINKLIGIGLGLVPFLASLFFYAQLLHKDGTGIIIYLLLSLLLYAGGWICVYIYKRTLHLDSIFTSLRKAGSETETEIESREFINFNTSNSKLVMRSGVWGIILIFLALWIYIGCFSLAGDTDRWRQVHSVIGVIFYLSGFIKFIHYLTAAFAAACGYFIFLKYSSDSEKQAETIDETDRFAIKFNSSLALILTLIQPIFFIINMLITPQSGLSFSLFIITILALVIVFAGSHFLYGILKENKKNYILASFIALLLVIGFFIVQQEWDFKFTNRQHEYVLASEYDKMEAAEMEKLGRATSKISGAEVYQTRCMPCHRFDQKIVGPPYNEVLGAYVGHKDELVKFILNPNKTRPGYPQMPNPGLKPKEADAVADFLLKTFQSGGKPQ